VQAIKLEGAHPHQALIQRLTDIGIPVMGHIGMTPQSIHHLGSYKRFGKNQQEAEQLMQEALLLQKSGAFAIVLECVQPEVAANITLELKIPTIGIGSGPNCDGQVLVINDLLGYSLTPPPAFVKPAMQMARLVQEVAAQYVQQTKEK